MTTVLLKKPLLKSKNIISVVQELFKIFYDEKVSLIKKNISSLLGKICSSLSFESLKGFFSQNDLKSTMMILVSLSENGLKIPKEIILNSLENHDPIIRVYALYIASYRI